MAAVDLGGAREPAGGGAALWRGPVGAGARRGLVSAGAAARRGLVGARTVHRGMPADAGAARGGAGLRTWLLPLVLLVVLVVPVLTACAPHEPPQGEVLQGEPLRAAFDEVETVRLLLTSVVPAREWATVRQVNADRLTPALNALGPAIFAADNSLWYTIVDAKYDLDEELQATEPDASIVGEALNALGARLHTARQKLGLAE
jgi:hypothetical protein